MHKGIYLLTGSNQGHREKNLLLAIKKINVLPGKILALSSLYQTAPWGKTDQPDFLNQVLEIESSLSPRNLLSALNKIELEIGKKSTERWGPREMDIDILFYGSQIVDETGLTIPHPSIPERRFTLLPFCEIAPEFVHPLLNKTCRELLIACIDPLPVSLYPPSNS